MKLTQEQFNASIKKQLERMCGLDKEVEEFIYEEIVSKVGEVVYDEGGCVVVEESGDTI